MALAGNQLRRCEPEPAERMGQEVTTGSELILLVTFGLGPDLPLLTETWAHLHELVVVPDT